MIRSLSRSRPEPMKPGVVECVCCLRQMGRVGALNLNRSRSWRGGWGRPALTLGRSARGGCPCPVRRSPGSGDERACGGDRRRRSDGADVGGRAGVGRDRCRHRRTPRQPGCRRIASRGSSLPHHRGARSAWHRRTIPLRGEGPRGRGVLRDRPGHQRLPDPPQIACAVAEPVRAHPGWMGR